MRAHQPIVRAHIVGAPRRQPRISTAPNRRSRAPSCSSAVRTVRRHLHGMSQDRYASTLIEQSRLLRTDNLQDTTRQAVPAYRLGLEAIRAEVSDRPRARTAVVDVWARIAVPITTWVAQINGRRPAVAANYQIWRDPLTRERAILIALRLQPEQRNVQVPLLQGPLATVARDQRSSSRSFRTRRGAEPADARRHGARSTASARPRRRSRTSRRGEALGGRPTTWLAVLRHACIR
jgi:hypothetical protein